MGQLQTNRLIPCNIDVVLPEILYGLTVACHPTTDPKDVIDECREGESFLLRCEDKSGFVVVRAQAHRETGKSELFIWVGYRNGKKSLETYLPQLEHIAQAMGAETIAFSTKRRGFTKTLNKKWKLRQAEFEYKVDNGR